MLISSRIKYAVAGGLLSILGIVATAFSGEIKKKIVDISNSYISNYGDWLTPSVSIVIILILIVILSSSIYVNLLLYNDYVKSKEQELEITRLSKKQEIELRRDPLTLIPNQRAMEEFLSGEYSKTISSDHYLSVIFVDLRNLKGINLKFGRSVESRYIQLFSTILYKEMQRKEIVFRLSPVGDNISVDKAMFRLHTGGDEFLIFLKGYEVDALFFLRRIMLALDEVREEFKKVLGIEVAQPLFDAAIYQPIIAPPQGLTESDQMSPDDKESTFNVLEELMKIAKEKGRGVAYGSQELPSPYRIYVRNVEIKSRMRSRNISIEAARSGLDKDYEFLTTQFKPYESSEPS